MKEALHMDNQIENEYAGGLANQKASNQSENARDNICRFYEENKEICDSAYEYYTEFERNKAKYVREPAHLEKSVFLECLKPKKILILTANPIERGIIIRWLSDYNGKALESYMVDSYSYNVFNDYKMKDNDISIIHVDPGITGEDYTRRVLNSTCKLFQPNCIVALGICYGFDRKKYSIGQVFLSESVTVFRVNYRDAEGGHVKLEAETEFERQPSYRLIQSLRERIMYTMARNFLSTENRPFYSQMALGRFLSINSLMSNTTAKQALVDQYGVIKPKPVGGEMEGPGILRSDIVQEKGFQNWLIVKSVCDWGEMKNNLSVDETESERIKDSLQALAMTNSCSVLDKILAELCEVCYG